MAILATPLKPSTTNNTGTALGLLVGGAVSKWALTAPFVIKLAALPVAAFLGIDALAIAGLIGVLATGLTSYGVTHVAELREANKLIEMLPKAYSAPSDFPNAPNDNPTPNNLNKG